jgi:hypothetical protein
MMTRRLGSQTWASTWSACAALLVASALAAPPRPRPAPEANYDESKIPPYTLPNPLVCEDGTPVTTAEMWRDKRRPELVRLFEEHVYGRMPEVRTPSWQVVSERDDALDGLASRTEFDVFFRPDRTGPSMRVLVFLPKSSTPVPVFLALNFRGNQAVHPDPEISLNTNWRRPSQDGTVQNHRATEASRGTASSRWPVEMILKRGYGLATAYYGDIDPDFDDNFRNGIHPLFAKPGQAAPDPDAWGSIAAWAYGLRCGLDYLESDSRIDASKVAVLGHSRLGKTALWAGAIDERFAIVISNNSGCGGAALSRRAFGETVHRINHAFPHWFCDNFNRSNSNENACPVDQHELIALVAPRPVYVASAVEDRWADPKGEFESAVHADPVYRLLGTDGFGGKAPPTELPAVNEPLASGTIGYHLRAGKHDVTEYDWRQYLDFADRHFNRKPSPAPSSGSGSPAVGEPGSRGL